MDWRLREHLANTTVLAARAKRALCCFLLYFYKQFSISGIALPWLLFSLIATAFPAVADDGNRQPATASKHNTIKRAYADALVLGLGGNEIQTIGVNAGAYFDHDVNGFSEKTGWIGTNEGLLALDRDDDGKINHGRELFGDWTLLKNGSRATNGFAALSEWDSNADGKIDRNDAIWKRLKVWRDTDLDGLSQPSELFSLEALQIRSINLDHTAVSHADDSGNILTMSGTFVKNDGTVGKIGNYRFARNVLYTIQDEYRKVTADIAVLPDLRGYGNVYDLQQAMVRDTGGQLKILVQNFTAETNLATRNNLLEQILFKWTGNDGIDPASRGGNFDARKLAVLEKFYGRQFMGVTGPNPILEAAVLLEKSYLGLSEMFYAQLMAQTHLKPFYSLIRYSWDSAEQAIKGDLTPVIAEIRSRLNADPQTGKLVLSEFTRTVKGLCAQKTLNLAGFRSVFAGEGDELVKIIDQAGYASHKCPDKGRKKTSRILPGDPASYDDNFDARKLAVLEKFFGRDAYDAFCDVCDSQTALA